MEYSLQLLMLSRVLGISGTVVIPADVSDPASPIHPARLTICGWPGLATSADGYSKTVPSSVDGSPGCSGDLQLPDKFRAV